MTDLTKYILETRVCKCGCKESYRCLTTSKQEFASKKCADFYAKFGKIEKKKTSVLSEQDMKEVAKINKLFKGQGRE